MDSDRNLWKGRHKDLRQLVDDPARHAQAVDLFLDLHSMVHAADVSGAKQPTFDDDLWDGLTQDAFRSLPASSEHSIAWCLWHIARIEDMTMNVLIAGRPQVFDAGDWSSPLKVTVRDTGNAMSSHEIALLTSTLDMDALPLYRRDVGRSTREVIPSLHPGDLQRNVDTARLQQLSDDGSVVPDAASVLDFWGSLTWGGLLLTPPSRHCLGHLNEALHLKARLLGRESGSASGAA